MFLTNHRLEITSRNKRTLVCLQFHLQFIILIRDFKSTEYFYSESYLFNGVTEKNSDRIMGDLKVLFLPQNLEMRN